MANGDRQRVEVARLLQEISALRGFVQLVRDGAYTRIEDVFFAAGESLKEADRIRTLPDDEILPEVKS